MSARFGRRKRRKAAAELARCKVKVATLQEAVSNMTWEHRCLLRAVGDVLSTDDADKVARAARKYGERPAMRTLKAIRFGHTYGISAPRLTQIINQGGW